ncbi:sensor histidine kinase [Actinoplanes sp. CA-142083]|uniref:sensor histidine kinase n=1 Tax=Actinoplanes sp. CA-142083 TaxID=3239903 RepID=UPI003D8B8FCA
MRTASWSRPPWWPWVVDAGLAVGLAVVCVLQGLDDDSGHWRAFDATAVALSVLATLPTVARRRWPVPVLLTCYFFWVWQIALGYNPVVTTYGVLLAAYTVAATQPWRPAAAYLSIGTVVWIGAGVSEHTASVAGVVLQGAVIPAVIWKVGDSNRRLAEANAQLNRDREERARRAVTDERVRIARELHDVVAHHMSVVAVQAGLAKYVLRTDPDTAENAIGTVLTTSGQAMDEMRRMLALLRVGAEPVVYEPVPGVPGLPDLFERVRSAGVPVQVAVTGTPQALPPGLQACVYRVVQESLTNILKHAAPATAMVAIDYRTDRLTVTVRDDGARARGSGQTGNGLIGMRERAMLYGGTLDAGPRPGGGFEVRLTLPTLEGDRPD